MLRISACKEVLTLKRNYFGTEKNNIQGIISVCLTFCYNFFTSNSFKYTLIAYQTVSFHMSVSQEKAEYEKGFSMFQNVLKETIARNENKRVNTHLR